MPRDSITRPAVVLKPADVKKQVIPWDSDRALELWQKRVAQGKPLPDVFADKVDFTGVPGHIIGRNKLVLKAANSAGLLYYTTDDE